MTLEIEAVVSERIAFASHQNDVPLIRELRIHNKGEEKFENLKLEFVSDPGFIGAREWTIDRLDPGTSTHVADLDLRMSGQQLLELVEAVSGELSFVLRRDEERLAVHRVPVEFLARNEWGGLHSMPELLAAFSAPNDPAVEQVLKTSAENLRRTKKDPAIDGYESGSSKRVVEIISVIWHSIRSLRLDYALPPSSFEEQGQKIRSPSAMLKHGRGTCLDLALFLAAALEQAGLNPILVFTRGHALTGVWLQDEQFNALLTEDVGAVRKRFELNELLLFESTLLTQRPGGEAQQALQDARKQIALENEADFLMAVDIKRARMQKIRPLVFSVEPEEPATGDRQADSGEGLEPPELLVVGPARKIEEKPQSPETRLDHWQRKLLDLSLRNRLLNFPKKRKTAVDICCPQPGKLEDRMADGMSVRFQPLPRLAHAQGRSNESYARRGEGKNLDEAYAMEALERGEVVVDLEKVELDKRLVALYRGARTDLQEGGINTLFLALGFLSWKRPREDRRHRAPLILVPVELIRRSVRSGVKMKLLEDEPRFNTTLLQLLHQDFGVTLQGLDGKLPEDEHGIDVDGIWNRVRDVIKDIPDFDVVKEVVLGRFSFAKYLMWEDLKQRADQLSENSVVRHLLETPGQPYRSKVEVKFPVAQNLDRDYPPGECFLPMAADSTQLSAVIACDKGKDFVLIGPPGTGKSQTISNMIADQLAKGRSVLFVSEKIAALEVVYRRLQAVGLGKFCLELHSNKTRKLDVLNQFREAWEAALPESGKSWEEESLRQREMRQNLNSLGDKLLRKHANGLSVYQAIGEVLCGAGKIKLDFHWPSAESHDSEWLHQLEACAHQLELHAGKANPVNQRRFASVQHEEWSPRWEQDLAQTATNLATAASDYRKKAERLCEALGVRFELLSLHDAQALAKLAQVLPAGARVDLSFALRPGAEQVFAAAQESFDLIEQYQRQLQEVSVKYRKNPWHRLNTARLTRQWQEASDAWWPKSYFGKRRIRNTLMLLGGCDDRPDCERDLTCFSSLEKLEQRLQELEQNANQASCWKGVHTDTQVARDVLRNAQGVKSAVAALGKKPEDLINLRSALGKILSEASELLASQGVIGRACKEVSESWDSLQELLRVYQKQAGCETLSPQLLPGQDCPPGQDWLTALSQSMRELADQRGTLRDWCAWLRVRSEAARKGLGKLTQAVEQGKIREGEITATLAVNYRRGWLEKVVEEDEVLRSFMREEYEDLLRRFKDASTQYTRLTQDYIQALVHARLPDRDQVTKDSGLALLRRELEKKKRHRSVRVLMESLHKDLTRLTPCLLMSPLSIAQYLPSNQELFDVVIFDEASQIKVWDAVGAIARGKQVIVVGDPKQLPPTSFFDRADEEADEEVDVEGDMESILDECLASGLPKWNLSWHYRSKHESLITFSNHHYYDGSLITFPSPVTEDRAVSFTYLEHGLYDRGKSRTNRVEADAIVKYVVDHLSASDQPESIGVVTLNSAQQELLENLLDEARRKQGDLERYFNGSEAYNEPVFIKNLESVQGDERDIILFSIGYGPDIHGRISMNFGPINKPGGERRLNVAITRARTALRVYSSLHPKQINLARTNATGVRDLKHFLEFADRGKRALAEAVQGPGGDFESPFEEAVARYLRDKGWRLHSQVGVSSFRIDLGVVHPDNAGQYLAGVECDGATYHRSATAQDRDKIREGILTQLGWKILRIWSTDWWFNHEKAGDNLHKALSKALEKSRTAPQPPTPPPTLS